MKKTIEFIDTTQSIPKDYYPKPSKRVFPDWYKKLESYPENLKDIKPVRSNYGTLKKCAPFLDALSSGYIIPLHLDIYVGQENNEDGGNSFFWPERPESAVTAHVYEQAKGYPGHPEDKPVPKFKNPWTIQTPKGYSCLFVSPYHHDLPFKVLEGVVDTDQYHMPVEILFSLKDQNFVGNIPAGTPMVQVIPFKREEWKMSSRYGNNKDIETFRKTKGKLESLFVNRYRNLFWDRKHFD